MTTAQSMQVLNRVMDNQKLIDTTQKFLENADMVKFAKFVPLPSVNEEMMKQAYDIVKKTKVDDHQDRGESCLIILPLHIRYFLYLLFILPLLILWYWKQNKKRSAAITYSNLDVFDGLNKTLKERLRHLPFLLRLIGLSFFNYCTCKTSIFFFR